MRKVINFFEIPVLQLDRAEAFYTNVLARPLTRQTCAGITYALLGDKADETNGCLVQADGMSPSQDGALIYLDVSPSLDAALSRAHQAGGRIALGKTELPNSMGVYAHIIDSEGNRTGRHAMQ